MIKQLATGAATVMLASSAYATDKPDVSTYHLLKNSPEHIQLFSYNLPKKEQCDHQDKSRSNILKCIDRVVENIESLHQYEKPWSISAFFKEGKVSMIGMYWERDDVSATWFIPNTNFDYKNPESWSAHTYKNLTNRIPVQVEGDIEEMFNRGIFVLFSHPKSKHYFQN